MLIFKSRPAATQFLRERGVQIGDTGLADLASDGRGPGYAVINGRALYRESDLVAWLEEQYSSAQLTARGRRRRTSAATA
jgi:hypothetical protein